MKNFVNKTFGRTLQLDILYTKKLRIELVFLFINPFFDNLTNYGISEYLALKAFN